MFLKSKFVSIFLIFSFVLFYSPCLLTAQEIRTGNLVGFVYAPDKTLAVEGAVIKLRNVSTGAVYESVGSDNLGFATIEGIEAGLYIAGISLEDKDYNMREMIGIRPGRTGKVALALAAEEQQKDEECPKGEWYVPEVDGECDEDYKWDDGDARCECKKKNFFAFFLTPAGIALALAATTATIVGVGAITGGTTEVSAFK